PAVGSADRSWGASLTPHGRTLPCVAGSIVRPSTGLPPRSRPPNGVAGRMVAGHGPGRRPRSPSARPPGGRRPYAGAGGAVSLLRAEIARLRRRRLTWGVVAVLAAAQVAVVAGTISASERPPLSVLSGPDYVFDYGSGLEALLTICYASLAVGSLVLGAGYAGQRVRARATPPPARPGRDRGRLLAARLTVAAGAGLALSILGTVVFFGGSGLLAVAADGTGIPGA